MRCYFIYSVVLAFCHLIGAQDVLCQVPKRGQAQEIQNATICQMDWSTALKWVVDIDKNAIDSLSGICDEWIALVYYHKLLQNQSQSARQLIRQKKWKPPPLDHWSDLDDLMLNLSISSELLKPKMDVVESLLSIGEKHPLPGAYLRSMILRLQSRQAQSEGRTLEQKRLKEGALEVLKKNGLEDHPETMILLRQLGNLARYYGEYNRAIAFFELEKLKYEELYGEAHIGVGIAAYHLGTIAYEMLEYEKAVSFYEMAKPIFINNRVSGRRLAYLYEALGDMYFELSQFASASDMWMKAADIRTPESADYLELNEEEVNKLVKEGDWESTIKVYKQALAFREHSYGRDHPLTGACRTYVGKALIKTGQYAAADQYFRQALESTLPNFDSLVFDGDLSENAITSFDKFAFEALHGLTELNLALYKQNERKLDYLDTAYHWARLAQHSLRHFRSSPRTDDSHHFWTERARPYFELAIEIGYTLWQQTQSEKYLDNVFQLLESSRSFLLKKEIHESEFLRINRVPDSIVVEERRLRSELINYRAKIEREEKRCEAANSEHVRTWKARMLDLELSYSLLKQEIEKDYPDYHQLIAEPDLIPLNSIRSSLDSTEYLLYYFIGDHRGYSMLVSRDTTAIVSFSQLTEIYSQVDTFLLAVRTPGFFLNPKNNARLHIGRSGYYLYDVLLRNPLRMVPDQSRIRILPDDVLYTLPFSALISDTSFQHRTYREWPFLVKNYDISYASTSAAITSKRQRKDGQIQYLGFGPVYPDVVDQDRNEFTRLRHNEEEVMYGARLFDGKALTGSRATKMCFLSTAEEATILHLATHATLDEDRPLLSGIKLSGDDSAFVHYYEIYKLNLRAELTILSGCETGRGKVHVGEGLASLSRAFQYAKCPSIMMTHWKVDDRSTSSIIKNSLENIHVGMPASTALVQAQRSYLKAADPVHAHPFYWAGISLIGQSNNSLIYSGSKNTKWFWWFCTFCISVIFYRFMRVKSSAA